ncbi:MAG: DUF1003 domain-containing protein [Planctomycetes bacterium]|nr:DUF1003 domain-containing protein [Planctomycetota bacterium]
MNDKSPSPTHAGSPVKRVCQICSKEFAHAQLIQAPSLRPNLSAFIGERYPDGWGDGSWICKICLAAERFEYLVSRLTAEKGELTAVEHEIAQKAASHQTLSSHIDEQFEAKATRGQRVADRVAAVGGSWPFVISFLVGILVWTGINTLALSSRAFDPYPYILLNLLLSCLAALQAPIIMMSQNRVATRDRLQANEDFRINLKAELEISSLHEKIDHLLHTQWQHMVELQQIQIDLLSELTTKGK